MAYNGLVRPILEYASPVWVPSGKTLQDELEKVQSRATRLVTGNYNSETGSMTKILEQLKWEFLKQWRKGSRLILFYKGLKGQGSIPVDDLKTPLRNTRNYHFKNHLESHRPGLKLISTVSSLEQLEIGMHSMHLLYPLLNAKLHINYVVVFFC